MRSPSAACCYWAADLAPARCFHRPRPPRPVVDGRGVPPLTQARQLFAASGLIETATGRRRRRRVISRSQHYLAAHKGANPLAALTEGYQSAFLACAVLAGIGLALAFLLPGPPRKPAHELPEPDPAADAAAAGDVVIRSGTK